MNRWRLPALVLVIAAPLACSDSDAPKVDEPTLDELLAAPTVLELDSEQLHLSTHLYLDRMPIVPPSPTGFSGEVRIYEEAQQPLPTGLNQTRVWVILDQDVWRGGALGKLEPQAPYELRRWLESDRGWGDVTVQVVVEASVDNVKYLLRAPDQSINVID